MADDWIVGGVIAAVVVVAAAAVAFYAGLLTLPAESLSAWPRDDPTQQGFRASQYVPEAVLTNHETITWTDAQGRPRQITVEREVR